MVSKRLNQYVQRKLAEEGTELTLDEIEQLRKEAYAKIRAEMKRQKIIMPDDDMDMTQLMHAMKNKLPYLVAKAPNGYTYLKPAKD